MKKKVVQYQIAEPCHENWGAMTPVEKGRFCDSCAKPVIDFTSMTDRQVLQFMNTITGSVCGRMTSRQLHRDFTIYQAEQARGFNLRALVLGAALSTFSAVQVNAQKETFQGKVATQEKVEERVTLGEVARVEPIKSPVMDTVFSGKVIDYRIDQFIESVEVTLFDSEGNELGTTLTNATGEFELPLDAARNPYKAVFKKETYEEVVFLFTDLLTTRDIRVELIEEIQMFMGVVAPHIEN